MPPASSQLPGHPGERSASAQASLLPKLQRRAGEPCKLPDAVHPACMGSEPSGHHALVPSSCGVAAFSHDGKFLAVAVELGRTQWDIHVRHFFCLNAVHAPYLRSSTLARKLLCNRGRVTQACLFPAVVCCRLFQARYVVRIRMRRFMTRSQHSCCQAAASGATLAWSMICLGHQIAHCWQRAPLTAPPECGT